MIDAVLIVDDSLTVRMDLAEAFAEAGFRAMPCATAREAREAVDREPIAVAVLDVRLPDGDGVELLEAFRARPDGDRLIVLMLSAEAEVKDRVRGLAMGADEYVGKPYEASYVVGKARELLRARGVGAVGGRPSLLVIDDSPTYREASREAFEGAGYRVLVAGTGEEGLRALAAHRPAAVVVDGELPGIDGPTVIRRIRLDPALRGTVCVLLTARDGGGAELNALDAGADAFVHKGEDMAVILARVAAALRAAMSRDAPPSSLALQRVLVVDASEAYRAHVSEALGGEGYDVVLARSGEEALELLAVQLVDCILLELDLPTLSGDETCRRIKAAPGLRDVPLIALIASDQRSRVIESLEAGADDVVAKESDDGMLKARVRAQIRRKQFEDEGRRIRETLLRKELEAAEARAARELAETRAALVEELQRKNEELEAFSYSVSHDLRAPLRSIDGFSAALVEDAGDHLDATAKEHVRRVRAAAQRMGELIDDLLELSRVGRTELRRTETDVTALAEMVLGSLRRGDVGRNVETVIEPGMIAHADMRLLQAVFENLLGNAWKFSSRTPGARISVTRERNEEQDVFHVADNGAGFDQAYAKKLFQPFQRLHREADFTGTGIGLATVRRIIERHGGRVWAEGEVGKGATMSFSLPRRRAPAAT
ncbi:MAG: multi-sensor signal transduction histidine kinase [Labilithrix sp.]|nr:multi-sensor signal transduction histidine kinase [Labilithrix sp.]